MKPIIEVKNLSKEYIISHNVQPYYTLRDSLAQAVKKPFTYFFSKDPSLKKEKFFALKDVSFSVMPGETIGIIGKNGAGKSTLLKVLSQITPPTSGSIYLRGRVASLLEVGTGFHPELTGRENIFLNGAILGMKQREIAKKFDEIVAFSGVEKFLDTPVKRYSSGMHVRLAFAVAAHLEPEILIVDEVLSVGDAEFQKKCLGKMGDISEKDGRTVLFVSHNLEAVKRICPNTIHLNEGGIEKIGKTEEVVDFYLNKDLKNDAVIKFVSKKNKIVEITKIAILNKNFEPSSSIPISENFFIDVDYEFFQRENNLLLSIIFQYGNEIILYSSESDKKGRYNNYVPGKYSTRIAVPAFLFNIGIYNFNICIHSYLVDLERKDNIVIEINSTNNPRSQFKPDHAVGRSAYLLDYSSSKTN